VDAVVSASGVGNAAEEATRLFEAVQDWARRSATAGSASASLGDHLATGAPECELCPICQLIAVLRTSRPELVAHLADAAGSLLAALRTAIDAHEREWSARKTTGVERIDIT
jgi:hypothetical protein